MLELLFWSPVILLAGLAVVCILRLPAARRRGLLPAALTAGTAAVILFPGGWLLGLWGLTWRTAPKAVLYVILCLSGLTAGVLTSGYLARWLAASRKGLRVCVETVAVLCLLYSMCCGFLGGILWAGDPEEQVSVWQGQTVIQGTDNFLKPTYYIYEYHGPLIRGNQPLSFNGRPLPDGEETQP